MEKEKLIAIVRGVESGLCLKVADALYDGGVRLMEVTYDQKNPDSWIKTAEAIEAISTAYAGKMRVGAGTVTERALVEMTCSHGGEFIISPDVNCGVIERTLELGLVSMPGAMTPTEIMAAHRAGADYVKLFPAGNLGPDYLKAVKAPINHVRLTAVGGVNEKNAAAFINAGAAGLGVGGNLSRREWIEAGEFDKLTEAAATLVGIIKAIG